MQKLLITSSDSVSSSLFQFDGDYKMPVIVCIPAMGVPAKNYIPLADNLQALGFSVVISELRGIDTSSVRASWKENFNFSDCIDMDLSAVMEYVNTNFPDSKKYFLGHSLGGQFASLYLAKHPHAVDGIILCASCTVFYKNWSFPKSIGLLTMTHFCLVISKIVGYFPGKKLGFGGREARGVITDWARNARTGGYVINGVNLDNALSKINTKILAINFDDDKLAPIQATNHLISKFGSSKVTYFGYSKSDIGAKIANHFSWLKHSQVISRNISDWTKEHN